MVQNGSANKGNQRHQLRNGQSKSAAQYYKAGQDVDESIGRVYHVRMSRRFVVLSLLSCILLAFAVGRTARMVLIVNPQRRVIEMTSALQQIEQEQQPKESVDGKTKAGSRSRRDVMHLPNPVLKNRPVPKTLYTAMNFDTARSATISSRFVVSTYDDDYDMHQPDGAACPAGDSANAASTNASPSGTPTAPDDSSNLVDDEVHLPAGQHLLMDIRNVQSAFLASEERLASAMLDVVGSCGLTLLSYHCHGLQPNGVSCVGVLLESHVSFHTWPSQGVITLDLFTCGAQSLLPIVSKVESLFGIPATSDGSETVWAYKVRGFGEETQEELTDLFTFPIGSMTEYKTELVSTNTNQQRIDVYDVIRPVYQTYQEYKKSLRDDDSYESQHREFFRPDRILFLDGVLQARRSTEIPYHEALVHPAMFAHENPKRVLLLNCAGGAALREVLKHNTVEKVVMVEDDEAAVRISRQMFPEFHDCSAFLGESGDRICFEDERVEIVYSNLYEWVSSREGVASAMTGFDVVILDDIFYVDIPAKYGDFISLLSEKTIDDVVLVVQVGESPRLDDPANEVSRKRYLSDFIHSLPKYGFDSVVDYEEAHLGFSTPWQFIVAFGAFSNGRRSWFQDSSRLELVMVNRTLPTRDGTLSLLHFDSAVMQGYKYPSRASEVVFCRGNPENIYCRNGHGFDPERPNYEGALKVAPSTLGENAGRGVFATIALPMHSYLDLSQVVHPVYMSPTAHDIAGKSYFTLGELYWGSIVGLYGWSYGLSFSHHGNVEIVVDTNLLCFLNHGCAGRSNLSYKLNVTEATADPDSVPEEILIHQFRLNDEYNPAAERNPEVFKRASPIRSIGRDEELFINYLALTGNKWDEDVLALRDQCEGGVGDVLEYELWIASAYGGSNDDDDDYDK